MWNFWDVEKVKTKEVLEAKQLLYLTNFYDISFENKPILSSICEHSGAISIQ